MAHVQDASIDHQLSLGICCMANKASSKPMEAILKRLKLSGSFLLVIFPEETILNDPIEKWPEVQCLIAFASKGFPLEKCIDYCNLRQPVIINNLESQRILSDRVAVYRTLADWGIPCPEFIVIDHNTIVPNGPNTLEETSDSIIYNGQVLSKPFVEKPQDGDRHDVWIYYAMNAGGGATKLFRKEKDKASAFDGEQQCIRRDGVYVYEPFLPTQGTDIKVYTLGVGYSHAEARKAPTIDGKVERSKDGKEVRYPVVLTQQEKAMSALIVKAFKQYVCGFDILRTEGGSIICDVNGWSFVKGNQKYYNDCGVLLRKHFLEACGIFDRHWDNRMILRPGEEEVGDTDLTSASEAHEDERLCCAIVVMRHGDRRPKEKMKFKTKLPELLCYFDQVPEGTDEVKLKRPEDMQKLLQTMQATAERLKTELGQAEAPRTDNDEVGGENRPGSPSHSCAEVRSELQNIELLIEVLEMQDRFSGLERKVQLKVGKWKSKDKEKDKDKKDKDNKDKEKEQDKDKEKDREGSKAGSRKAAQIVVVAKWGGELTIAGLDQAEELGRRLRSSLYPNDPTGLLRLHSSFRHDFKIYSSQEGRCQITAASFTKGFLDLEGDITPILASLVTCDNYARELLDEPIPKKQRDVVKAKIESLLMSMVDLDASDGLSALREDLLEAARRVGKPWQLMHKLKDLCLKYIDTMMASISKLTEELANHEGDDGQTECEEYKEHLKRQRKGMVPRGPGPQVPLDLKDKLKRRWLHLRRKAHRWRKLIHGFAQQRDSNQGFSDENVTYDVSKIPDVWDNVYYDMMTHRDELGTESCIVAEEMIDLLQPLNNWVCWSEYGISLHEKLRIGVDVTWRLIGKVLVDLEFMIDESVGRLTDEAGKMLEEKRSVDTGKMKDKKMSIQGLGDVDEKTPEKRKELGGSDEGSPSSPSSPKSKDFLRKNVSMSSVSSSDKGQSRTAKPAPALRNELKRALTDSSDWHPRLNEEVARLTGIKATQRVKSRVYVTSASTLHSLFNVLWHGSDDGVVSKKGHITDLNYLTHIVFRCYERIPSAAEQDEARHRKSSCSSLKSSMSHPDMSEMVESSQQVSASMKDGDKNSKSGFLGGYAQDHQKGKTKLKSSNSQPDISGFNKWHKEGNNCSPRLIKTAEAERAKANYRVEISVSPGVQVLDGATVKQWPTGSEFRKDCCSVAPLEVVAESVPLGDLENFLEEVVREYSVQSDEESSDAGNN